MDSRKRIADAMRALMRSRRARDISFGALLSESDVSRSTFYRHFKDKSDLIGYCYVRDLERLYAEKKDLCWPEMSAAIFDMLYADKKYYSNLFYNIKQVNDRMLAHSVRLYEGKYLAFSGKASLSAEEGIIIRQYCAGALRYVTEWVQGGMREPPSAVSRCMCDGMPRILAQCLCQGPPGRDCPGG
jgi:AcrR family transcriptional regulator